MSGAAKRPLRPRNHKLPLAGSARLVVDQNDELSHRLPRRHMRDRLPTLGERPGAAHPRRYAAIVPEPEEGADLMGIGLGISRRERAREDAATAS